GSRNRPRILSDSASLGIPRRAPDVVIAPPVPAVVLTHDDSLRIAEAVRAEMAKARLNAPQQPNAARKLDSLQQTLVRVKTDSAMREARQAATAPAPPVTPRLSGGTRGAVRASPRAAPAPKAIFARP